MKVLDADYVERDMEWAEQRYGVGYRRAAPNAAGWVYRLVVLQEKWSSSALVTKVLDEAGRPINKADVAFWWTGAPRPPEPRTEVYAHDHYPNFIHGETNPNGDVGPGMGKGAWVDVDPVTGHVIIDKTQDGPHAVWVRDPGIPSDICVRLGMRGGTNHDHVDQTFQLVREGEAPPSPPPPAGQFVVVERDDVPPTEGNGMEIEVVEGVGYDFRRSIFKARVVRPGTDEVWMELPDVEPDNRRRVYMGCTYEAGADEKSREYQLRPCDVETDEPQGDWIGVVFETGKLRRVNIKVDWEGEEEPEPEPEPEPPPAPEPEPEPECGWTMTVERRPGIRLIVGKGLPEGTIVSVVAPWGLRQHLVAGTKPEWGAGGWEMNYWNDAVYTVAFGGCVFEAEARNETVICTFVEGEAPAPEVRMRVVSGCMGEEEAAGLLWALEAGGFDEFMLERCL